MGMTSEQFWEQDCTLVRAYRRAFKIRQDRENYFAWLQGMYFYEAICDVSPILHAFAKSGTRPRPYPDKPYEFAVKKPKEETNAEKQTRTANYLNELASRFNRSILSRGDVSAGHYAETEYRSERDVGGAGAQ